ncbi:MAG: hypothetical protein J7J99_03860 [Thermoprotei archaeon]|nr:hypothetical protein [Thermoprotei archaeon]
MSLLEKCKILSDKYSITKLVLLMFIVDYINFRRYGKKLTDFVWRKCSLVLTLIILKK